MKKILALSLISSALLFAADKAEKEVSFVTHTELSYVRTQGNTDTTALSLDFTGTQKINDFSIKLDLDALYGDENSIENKNKLIGEVNFDYQFSKYFTVNYLYGYKDDKFSGFEYQQYTGPGVKYIAVASKVHNLDIQANALYSQDNEMLKYYDNATGDEVKYPYSEGLNNAAPDSLSGQIKYYTGFIAKFNYNWQVNDSLKFLQEASYRGDFDDNNNYFAFSKTGIESKLASMLSLGISYKIDYTNLPPAGNLYTDTTFMTSLIIDY